MLEYRTSAHAVFDIKYHFVWITKYRYKILRGRVAERARDVLRQICQAREMVIVRGAVSPDHIHMLVSCSPDMAPAKLVQYLKGRVVAKAESCKTSFRTCESGMGNSTCGRGVTFARVWARWTRTRSRSTSRARNGMTMIRDSRSPRPPSLEPALSREPFRRL